MSAAVEVVLVVAVVLLVCVSVGWWLGEWVFDRVDGERGELRVVRSESETLIETWRQKYLRGEIECWEFEDGVWCALTGAPDAETIARAAQIQASRVPDDEPPMERCHYVNTSVGVSVVEAGPTVEQVARAEEIRAQRILHDEWFRLAHERRIAEIEASVEQVVR